MAQSDKSPAKNPASVDDIVAALLVLGLDLSTLGLGQLNSGARSSGTHTNSGAENATVEQDDRAIDNDADDLCIIEDDIYASPPSVTTESSISVISGASDSAPTAVSSNPAPVTSAPVASTHATIAASTPVATVPSSGGCAGATASGASGAGFICANCNSFNPIRPSSGAVYYVVTIGLQVGIFTDWHIVQPLVSGVSNACYRRYSDEGVARAAFNEALDAGLVMVVAPTGTAPVYMAPSAGPSGRCD